VEVSIIAPAHNEQDNVPGLIDDVRQAMADTGITFEMIVVNDGSTDRTESMLLNQAVQHPWLHVYRMLATPHGKGHGQSAAFHAGIRQARSELIALMDADRQNDPADLPKMIAMLREKGADMVHGDRSANRRDTLVRRCSSWVGRASRRTVLGDTIRDTGCSLRVFKREVGLALPLQYRGVHRFIPVYTRMLGYTVLETSVNHRQRAAGTAKYGIWNRAIPGLIDLFAVRWMRSRLRPVQCEPVRPAADANAARDAS
jgi:glycosyltransferase involved in cell wall biosynthesis